MQARKSNLRYKIVDRIMKSLKHDEVFSHMKYKQKTESEIQNRMSVPLRREVTKMYEEIKGFVPKTALKRTNTDVSSEEDPNTTVNNFMFMGVQHRPDFTIDFDGLNIAVEIKKGDSGQSIREGIGQSVVYNTNFDFTVYLYVDTSKDSRIKNAFNGEREQKMVKDLWNNHNVLFGVV